MRVFWASSAERDRTDIFDFIAQDKPLAAVRMDELFAAAASRLREHRLIGATGRIPGTRELIPHESYRMVHEVKNGAGWILALVHTAVVVVHIDEPQRVMRHPTYRQKDRHGTFYFRARTPSYLRQRHPHLPAETKASLGSTSRMLDGRRRYHSAASAPMQPPWRARPQKRRSNPMPMLCAQ